MKPSDGQEISLRPNAGVAPTKIQVPINSDSQENTTSKPTWVNKVQQQQQQQPVSGNNKALRKWLDLQYWLIPIIVI